MTGWKERVSIGTPRTAVVVHDLCMVWLTWIGLHQFRYAILPQPPSLTLWSVETIIVLLAQGLVFWRVGLYRGIWRFASVPDLLNILKASVFGLLALVAGLFLYNRLDQVPTDGPGAVPDRTDGAAGHAAPAVPGVEGLPTERHGQDGAPGADPRRWPGR
jgi:hypothetical protein